MKPKKTAVKSGGFYPVKTAKKSAVSAPIHEIEEEE
jgi:hypothetical protein